MICGLKQFVTDLPDAGEGMCCYGAALYGPERCTCWEPVYDLDQQPIQPGLPLPRTRMCGDCAYRPSSPERAGDPGYAGDQEELERLVVSGQPFYCHQGMRRPVAWRHPSGVEIPGHPAAYDPPKADGVPYRADGAPGELCAGWVWRSVQVAETDTLRDETARDGTAEKWAVAGVTLTEEPR